MSQYARVDSVEALKLFRLALAKFAESANTALADAEGELQRTLMWLETEQHTYWQGQVRKRTEILSKAKEALRMKKLFKGPAGGRQSVVDEEKAVQVATK